MVAIKIECCDTLTRNQPQILGWMHKNYSTLCKAHIFIDHFSGLCRCKRYILSLKKSLEYLTYCSPLIIHKLGTNTEINSRPRSLVGCSTINDNCWPLAALTCGYTSSAVCCIPAFSNAMSFHSIACTFT